MRTSTPNQFLGTIKQLNIGHVNSELILEIGTDQLVVAIVTQESVKNLGLAIGKECIALIKASSVIISSDIGVVTSARNKLVGIVSQSETGAINTNITLDIGGGQYVSAMVTNTSANELGLAVGSYACALFKASSVILMVA